MAWQICDQENGIQKMDNYLIAFKNNYNNSNHVYDTLHACNP
jgi:hypothetical protein